jgi:hypothetical protein
MVWAYFSTFQTTLLTIYTQAKALELGLENSNKFINVDGIRDMLKKALPHQANLIDQWDLTSFYLFVDELEGCILIELTKMLDGEDVDQASIVRSTAIMKSLKSVTDQLNLAPADAAVL